MTVWNLILFVTMKRPRSRIVSSRGGPCISMRPFIIAIVFSIFTLSPLMAAGSATGSGDADHDNHDENPEMTLPRIEPVSLDGRKLKVVATTSFIGDVVTNIAGSAAEITILMPRGQNPHSWEPSPRNIAAIDDADLIFINGLGLEETLIGILGDMKTAPVVPVSKGIDVIGTGEQDDHHPGAVNPHVWFSPRNVIIWTRNMEKSLSLVNPTNAETYEMAAEAYISELEALDSELRKMLSILNPDDKKLVMDHATFDYYAREYGFNNPGNVIPSMNDQAEPSARDIAALTELVKAENVKAIFVGGTAGRGLKNLAASVAAEADRELPVVELLTGSLAPEGQRGANYRDFIRYNTEMIVEALSRE